MKQDNEVILKKIYPLIEQAISRRVSQYKQYISKFIAARAEDLYAIAPYRRIYFTDNDRDEFFIESICAIESIKNSNTPIIPNVT